MDDQPPPKRVKLRNEDDPGKLKIKKQNFFSVSQQNFEKNEKKCSS